MNEVATSTQRRRVIHMKKRTYRGVEVKKVNRARLGEAVAGKDLVVGVDVGKEVCFGSLVGVEGVQVTVKWKGLWESRDFVELLCGLGCRSIEVAMEPSGTYGDPLRSLLWEAGVPVYRVSAKRSHDAAEVYDGVPSWHDAKSAAIIAKLHKDGASDLWPFRSEKERDLRAVVTTMDLLDQQFHENVNRLEGHMARHWPEVGTWLELSSVTFLEMILRFGGPEQIVAKQEEARETMRAVGGRFLKEEKIEAVVESSGNTIGVPMTAQEVEELRKLSNRTLDLYRHLQTTRRKVDRMSQDRASIQAMSRAVGKGTAAVLVVEGGDPEQYGSSSEWLKGFGLNLKERSSGKHIGKLKITKRGSGKARKWLYLAALRLIQKDLIVRTWYERKVARDGGVKKKAIVAVMRKLVRALWYVGRGEPLDTSKLFDVKKLGLSFG
jgi:transposase